VGLLGVAFALAQPVRLLAQVGAATWGGLLEAAGATLLRTVAALAIGAAWTIPVGVAIGLSPRWSRRLQPVVQGKRYAEAGLLEKKTIFREQALARIALLRQIQQALEAAPDHTIAETSVIERLEAHFSNEEAWAQLETAVSWGRYAELFTYHEDSGLFELEEPESLPQT
jgi:hypothetical protein